MIRRLFSIFRESTQSFHDQEAGEKVVLILRRHYFTILVPLILLGLAGFVPVVAWTIFEMQLRILGLTSLFFFVSSIWYLALWLSTFYFLTIYILNTVIVTDRRIIDNDQHGFFNREVSELHTYRVQDVSVHTNGIIETFLSFGDIVVQTAASEKQFVFHQIPEPERVKDIVMKIVSEHRSKMRLS
ncbi:MAG: PH domain-containing protein [Candidatus Zambryskibacteria bacterium]|nr:PH domain-containing protein [Candidatus Zambryskibacteria bacterium]